MPTTIQTFKQYPNPIFVETGSYIGDGIQQALDSGFPRVVSVELGVQYYNRCCARFNTDTRVKLVLGDSSIILWDVIKGIDVPITFWLDGHYSGGDTARGKFLSPLIQELELIARHPIKTHTILIDDVRCWSGLHNEYHDDFTTDTLKASLLKINPGYCVELIDGQQVSGQILPKDILVARPV